MKNLKIRTITIAIMLLAMVIALTGCNGSTTTVEEEKTPLENMQVITEKEAEGKLIPTVLVWIDESTSISKEEKVVLEEKAAELSLNNNAYGPYPFGGGATGMSTGDGWTDLTAPLQVSGNNSIIYILTDGWQDAPGALEGRSFVGPYWGMEVHFVCLERDEHTEELKNTLENSKEYFRYSTVIVEYLDGTSKDVIIQEFTPQRVTALYEDTDTLYRLSEEAEENIATKQQQWPWWAWLLLVLVLIPLILLLLWWLLRRRNNTASEERITEPDDDERYVEEHSTAVTEPDDDEGYVEEPSIAVTEPDDQGYAIGPSTGSNEDYTYCNCCQHRCCRCNNIAIVAMVSIVAIVAIAAMVIVFW